ncbi:MAG TPA: hypothetical protein VHX90_01200 [Verrucomicrobiae bacterium]|jgi:predicted nucleotidyltransferase|nr:hypothetical protein [Verrucomicrobiae bacterium]
MTPEHREIKLRLNLHRVTKKLGEFVLAFEDLSKAFFTDEELKAYRRELKKTKKGKSCS